MTDVSALVDALKRGEDGAWREFVDRYGRLIHAVAARSGLDQADREDVFQATCLVAVRTIDTLRDATRLSSWLYGIAVRLSVNQHRSRKRRGTELDVTEPTVDVATEAEAGEALERLESVSHLQDALAAIDERCAALVEALYLEDPRPSYDTISARFDMPVGSIGPTRARCLKKLQALLLEREA